MVMPSSAAIDWQAFDAKVAQLNSRLKAARLGSQIERRGDKLNLRGTFPPKPGSDRLRPHQQRLSLSLPATPAGLKQIEQQAKLIAADILRDQFSWKDYRTDGRRLDQLQLHEQITAFEAHFFAHDRRQAKPASSKTTWESAYKPYLRKLVQQQIQHPNRSLAELLQQTLHSIAPNTRGRQLGCTAIGAFARFLNLELSFDLKTLAGNYGTSQTQARQLPSDDDILTHWQNIPNPAWQFVYGVMATYGLRNHEVFFCNYDTLRQGEPRIEVLSSTKTGHHEVWPFHPEWIAQFNLQEICLPAIATDLTQTTLQRIGQRVTAQFRRYGVPFSPYDLRHAWAIRTIHMGLSDTVAAKMMGHSVAVHTRTYHQWITRRDQQLAVDIALQRRQEYRRS
jgi:integrase